MLWDSFEWKNSIIRYTKIDGHKQNVVLQMLKSVRNILIVIQDVLVQCKLFNSKILNFWGSLAVPCLCFYPF